MVAALKDLGIWMFSHKMQENHLKFVYKHKNARSVVLAN